MQESPSDARAEAPPPGAGRHASLRDAEQRLKALIESDRAAPPLHRRVAACLVALAAFAAAAAALRDASEALAPGSPFEPGSPSRRKLLELERTRDEYDVIFVGTSRVYRQFDPARFDARMAELGHPTRSYNLGLGGMRHPEVRSLVRRVLRDRPARLRWLLVDLTAEVTRDIDGLLHEKSAWSRRVVDWHRPDLTALVCLGALTDERLTPAQRLDAVATHLAHFGLRATNVGLGRAAVRALLGLDAPDAVPVLERRGHFSLDDEAERDPVTSRTAEARARRRRHLSFRRNLDWLAEERAELRARTYDPPHPLVVASFAELVEEARAVGVEPVFVKTPPHWAPFAGMYREDRRFGLPNLIDLADPDEHPAFYHPALYYNRHHLNEVGARLFSERLAEALAAEIGAR